MNITALCVNCKKNNSCTRCWKTSNKKCPYFTQKTNADRIRAMSDEELAQEMIFFCPTDTVFKGTETYEKPHYTGLDGSYYSTSEELAAANLKWLKQPAEESENETVGERKDGDD